MSSAQAMHIQLETRIRSDPATERFEVEALGALGYNQRASWKSASNIEMSPKLGDPTRRAKEILGTNMMGYSSQLISRSGSKAP